MVEKKAQSKSNDDNQVDSHGQNHAEESQGTPALTELEQVQQKCDEYLNGWKRAKADYINLKKETEKRQAEVIQYANAALLAQLFPIIDNFKLALRHVPEEQKQQDWVVGLDHIQKQFTDFLEQLGITPIETVGKKFDPAFHEAVSHEAVADTESDVIFEEVQPGYLLHGKVLQVARVKVAK